MSLSVCPSCSRHVRESVCPFCGASVALDAPRVARHLPRIAILGAAAAAATTIAACSSEPMYGCVCPADAGYDAQQDAMATFYGGPPIDASSFDSGKNDASDATTSDATTSDASDAGTDGD